MSARFNVVGSKKPVERMTVLEKGLYHMFASNFKDAKEWQAYSNARMYKPSMDKSIYDQKIGKTPEICEVYWKGEFVCDISIMDTPAQALQKIYDRLIELIAKKNKKGG